jgi:hypothetical protein
VRVRWVKGLMGRRGENTPECRVGASYSKGKLTTRKTVGRVRVNSGWRVGVWGREMQKWGGCMGRARRSTP